MTLMEERLRILKMVEEGKLSPEEATQLLEALKETASKPHPSSPQEGAPRWLRIRITEGDGTKVNVNLPLRLVKVALRVAERYGGLDNEASHEILAALEEAIATGETGRIVEVIDEEDGDRVEIYVE